MDNLVERQLLAVLVLDLGFKSRPVEYESTTRHQWAWALIERALSAEEIEKAIATLEDIDKTCVAAGAENNYPYLNNYPTNDNALHDLCVAYAAMMKEFAATDYDICLYDHPLGPGESPTYRIYDPHGNSVNHPYLFDTGVDAWIWLKKEVLSK